jgi:phosphatidylserine synthase
VTKNRQPSTSGTRRRRVIAVVVGLVLAGLMVQPWPQDEYEPMILGVMPASLFFWIVWTAAFVVYVAWIMYRWDPYAGVVERNTPSTDDES